MDNKAILSSLAMDLKRVAVGIRRKSYGMADRFLAEAVKRVSEVNTAELAPYMQTILKRVGTLDALNTDRRAEDALMYSIRIQNYVLYK